MNPLHAPRNRSALAGLVLGALCAACGDGAAPTDPETSTPASAQAAEPSADAKLVDALPEPEPEPATQPTEPSALPLLDRVRTLSADYQVAVNEFMEEYRALRDASARNELVEESYPMPRDWAPRYLELAREDPKDDGAFEAAVWVLRNAQKAEHVAGAFEVLGEGFADDDRFGMLLAGFDLPLGAGPSDALAAAVEKSDSSQTRIAGYQILAKGASTLASLVERLDEFNEEQKKGLDELLGEGTMAGLAEDGAASHVKRAAVWGSRIAKELPDQTGTRLGMLAREIEAPDLEGVNFKLSDYRGKVVALVFWGDW